MIEINIPKEQGCVDLRRAIQECTQCRLSVAVPRKSGSDDDRGRNGDARGDINGGVGNSGQGEGKE